MSINNGHSKLNEQKNKLSDHHSETPTTSKSYPRKNLAFSVENLISSTIDQTAVDESTVEERVEKSSTATPVMPVPMFPNSMMNESNAAAAAAAAAAIFSSFGMALPGCMAQAAAFGLLNPAMNGMAGANLLMPATNNGQTPQGISISTPTNAGLALAQQQPRQAPPDTSPVFGLTSQFSWLPGDRDSPGKSIFGYFRSAKHG